MTLTLLRFWNSSHHHLYVVATTRPGEFSAFPTSNSTTHLFSFTKYLLAHRAITLTSISQSKKAVRAGI
jgi:hypothetical protein